MPQRYAMRFTKELAAMATALVGSEESALDEITEANMFMIVEPLTETKFMLEIMSEDEVLAEYSTGNTLTVLY